MAPNLVTPMRAALEAITGFCEQLRRFTKLTWDEYRQDEDRRLIVERRLEVILEAVTDVARLYLLFAGKSAGLNRAASLRTLRELDVIPPDLAEVLIGFVASRNVFAHTYLGIDDRRIYNMLQQSESVFPRFVAAVGLALPEQAPGDEP